MAQFVSVLDQWHGVYYDVGNFQKEFAMDRFKSLTGLALMGALLAGGCGSDNSYKPMAPDTQLSAFAARQKFPTADAQKLPDVIFNVADNGVITVSNASNSGLPEFNLWVNGQFVIDMKDGLPAHNSIQIHPEQIFNAIGANLTSVKPESINQVQVAVDGKLFNLAGPVKPMPQN